MPAWGIFNIPPNVPPGPNPNGFPGTRYTSTVTANANVIYDVHKNYAWTLNKWEVRKYVPKIKFTEYKLTQSGELNSLRLSLAASSESVAGAAVRGAGAGALIGGALAGPAGQGRGIAIGAAAGALFGTLNQFAGTGVGTELTTGLNPQEPYKGLYPAKPTNNIYVLPYLNVDNLSDTSGTVGGWKAADEKLSSALGTLGRAASTYIDEDEVFGRALAAINEAAKAGQTIEMSLKPGAAVEKIKVFAPKEDGDAINLTFYLSNTGDFSDIQLNWNFLYKLTSQNLPNRRSINLLDPPCVYDVEVPGFKRFPIAAIESLKITNEGTTRYVDVTTGEMKEGGMGGSNVKLIPEAYKVTLTVRSLLMNTRNLFSYANGSEYNNVNVFEGSTASNFSPLTLPGKFQ